MAYIIRGRYHRSFWYRHDACGLPSRWNSICGETLIKYNQNMRASCSGHVLSTCGAMLSGPLALLGFMYWNSRRTSSSLVWSLWKSSSAADAPLKTSWICSYFREKSWQSKRLKNWFTSLAWSAVFTEEFRSYYVYSAACCPDFLLHPLLAFSFFSSCCFISSILFASFWSE